MKEKEKREFYISRELHFTVRAVAAVVALVLILLTGRAAITFCLGLFADGEHVVNLPGQGSPIVLVNDRTEPTEPIHLDPGQVVEIALHDNATGLILAHNHLSDVALPSNADLAATRQIRSTLMGVGVVLADHIIVSGDEYVSMRDSGYFINV